MYIVQIFFELQKTGVFPRSVDEDFEVSLPAPATMPLREHCESPLVRLRRRVLHDRLPHAAPFAILQGVPKAFACFAPNGRRLGPMRSKLSN
jgi:hypothetical protein